MAAGAFAMRGKIAGLMPATLLAAVAGLFHGWAYGAAVVGAEATPLLAYLAGFGVTQLLIAVVVGIFVRQLWKVARADAARAVECRPYIPVEMRELIEAEELLWPFPVVSSFQCPTCYKKLKNGDGAMKDHVWWKKECRLGNPLDM